MLNKAIIALIGAVGALNLHPTASSDQYLSQVDAEAILEEEQDLGEMKHLLEKKQKEWEAYVSSFEANIEAEREFKEA